MFKPQDGIGDDGRDVPGPPWILGHRGVPREAPENTLAGLRLALERGLDGVEYDVQGCATGEPVLIHDDTLDRTTDGHGPVSELTLPELAGLDAGGWFRKEFAGEPLPLLEEALVLAGAEAGAFQHMIELKDPRLVGEVARQLRQLPRPLAARIASFHRSVCLEARDLGLPSMLLALDANEDDRRFVRDERIAAYGTAPGGWRTRAGRDEWTCERWSWSVDEPADLLEACRLPLFGFNTNEPRRALATRALVALAPADAGPYPLEVPRLEVPASRGESGEHGAWSGRWDERIRVRNPFPYPVELAVAIALRGGAFEVDGLPLASEVGVGGSLEVPIRVAGGSWSPSDDPVVYARFVWARGPGRPRESLVLEAPLVRVRTLSLGRDPVRLPLLCERPGERPASMTVRRRGRELLAWVEDAAGAVDARAVVRIGSLVRTGGHGVRAPLPEGFDERSDGVDFSAGFLGRDPGGGRGRRLRRWAGGLPYGLGSGAPGRLLPLARA